MRGRGEIYTSEDVFVGRLLYGLIKWDETCRKKNERTADGE